MSHFERFLPTSSMNGASKDCTSGSRGGSTGRAVAAPRAAAISSCPLAKQQEAPKGHSSKRTGHWVTPLTPGDVFSVRFSHNQDAAGRVSEVQMSEGSALTSSTFGFNK